MTDTDKPVARPGETLVHLHFIDPATNDRSTWIGTSVHRALLRDADGRLNLEATIDVDSAPAPASATDPDETSPNSRRLAELERRQDAIWDVVLDLRRSTAASGLDPYKDQTAQALSAILTGATAWQITYGTLIEARDDLEAAKARAVDLWERTKFETEEHATDWEERAGGTLALIAGDEEQWFDCGPVIRRLGAEPQPQIEGQTQIAGVAL